MEPITKRSFIVAFVLSLLCASLSWCVHVLPFAPFTVKDEHPVDILALALILGIALKAVLNLSLETSSWLKSISKLMLSIGIALLGAKLDLPMILERSSQSLLLSLVCVVIALLLTEFLGIKLGVSRRLARLIAIGTSICGGTAIAVTSPLIKASDEEVALSIASVTLFGVLCMLVMPTLGTFLSLSEEQFGLWSGLLVHATPQVIATAYSYGPTAGEIAIVVKLTRVMMLVPLLIVLQFTHQTQPDAKSSPSKTKLQLNQVFPPFLFVFLLLASLNSLGYIPKNITFLESLGFIEHSSQQVLSLLSKGSMLVAMSAIGLLVDIQKLLALGYKPFIGGLLATIIMGTISLALLY